MRCCVRDSPEFRSGFTLLEVVLGIVLLATLVSAVVLATSAQQRKLALAQRKTLAIQTAERLLSGWTRKTIDIPLRDSGVDEPTQFLWRTEVVSSRTVCLVPVYVVRLTIQNLNPSGALTQLCAVEVLVDATARTGGSR